MFKTDTKFFQSFWYSARLALASSLAVYAAHLLGLQFETQAGIICIFSMLTTRKDTIKVSISRIVSFLVTAITAWCAFTYLGNQWLALGIYFMITVLVSEMMGWKAALSANLVAGCHFFSVNDFSEAVIINEFFIVMIGIVFALVFNFIHNDEWARYRLNKDVESVKQAMTEAMEDIAEYLSSRETNDSVWDKLTALHLQLDEIIHRATDYEGNSLGKDADYYYQYFEMRKEQCFILESLHAEMDKIRYQPRQARIITEFIYHISGSAAEKNDPQKQIDYLVEIFDRMKREALPASREEFESRAMLYHILMDLEEFLLVKKHFLDQRRQGREE